MIKFVPLLIKVIFGKLRKRMTETAKKDIIKKQQKIIQMEERMKKRIISSFLIAVLAFGCAVPSVSAKEEANMLNLTEDNSLPMVSLGEDSSAAIRDNGSLWMWGENFNGQLGDGTDVTRSTPVGIMTNVKSVSLGAFHSAAIKEDGSLWMWGSNGHGQYGDGTYISSNIPVKIMENVKNAALGYESTAVIKEDGSLWMWGNVEWARSGNTISSNTPVKVMENVKSVSIGIFDTAVIKEDDSLWVFGHNYGGDSSEGIDGNLVEPVKLMDGARSVSLGFTHSGVIKKDGSLWMWGNNDYGKLGDGTEIKRSEPVKIMDHVKNISLGNNYSAALKEDGSVWTWGLNSNGQLGDGTEINRSTPVKIMDHAKSIEMGAVHSAAIKEDGVLWMWGAASRGQLGESLYGNRTTPQPVTNLIPMMDFQDVKEDDWFYPSVLYVNNKWIMTGYTTEVFGPEDSLNRAEFATILYRMTGFQNVKYSDKYLDIWEGQYYTTPVLWAGSEEVKVMTGYEDGCFGPADFITREQMAVTLYRYANYKGCDTAVRAGLDGFPDGGSVSAFAEEAMQWAVASELISGNKDGTLAPQGETSRAVCATIMTRFMEKIMK